MRLVAVLALAACQAADEVADTGAPDADDTAADTGSGGEEEEEVDALAIGDPMPSFALEDLNPTSATYGQVVSSADLGGAPYAVIFLDSRCMTCPEVTADLWTLFTEHPDWYAAMPTFGIQSIWAQENAAPLTDAMVEGNDLPYLLDDEGSNLWVSCSAANHELFAVAADGTLDAWLPMYAWPEDMQLLVDYLAEEFGG